MRATNNLLDPLHPDRGSACAQWMLGALREEVRVAHACTPEGHDGD